MSLPLLALLWAATSGGISLLSVRLFLGRLISRSCAFVIVPLAIAFIMVTVFQKAALVFNPFYLIFFPLVVSVIMLLISVVALGKRDFQQESFWKSVNVLSFIIIVVFSQSNFATQGLDQILYRGYINESTESVGSGGFTVVSSVVDESSVIKTIVLTESYGYIFLPLILLSVFLSFYISPKSKGHMFPWWFVILATSIVVMSLFLTGGLFCLALVVSVPYIVAKEGMGLRTLNMRAMLAGIFFGLSAIAFNLVSGLPSALGGTLIVYAVLASFRKGCQ